MAETKKAFILTPKTLLGGVAGAALVASLALAPLSFAYADASNDSSSSSVSEDGEAANPAREAAETSMNNLGLDMEKTTSEMADVARKVGDGADHDGENHAKNSGSDKADQGGDHVDQTGDHVDQAGEHADQAGDHAGNQESVDKNAAPLMLADFLSSLRGGNQVVSSEGASSNLELRYGNGWKEEIDHGRYVLVDPNGNKIVNRLVTDADISRMRSALK